MTRYEVLKLLHVVLAIVWVGGAVLTVTFAYRAVRADHGHRLGLARDMEVVGDRVFAPSSILLLLFGIWMVLDTPGLSFGDTWIVLGLVGVAFSVILGAAVITPMSKRLTSELESGGRGAAGLTRIRTLATVELVVLVVVVWAMVVKPGA